MRYVFFALLIVIIFIALVKNDRSGSPFHPFFNTAPEKNAAESVKINPKDKELSEFIKKVEDNKDDLNFLQHQVDSLTQGLEELPNKSQGDYFKDLLTKIQDKENLLKQQIAKQRQEYRDNYQYMHPQENTNPSRLSEQNQENLRNQMERSRDMMEAQQMRMQDQVERMNDLLEQNQDRMRALIDRTNEIAEQNQIRSEQNQMRMENSRQKN